PCAEGQQALLLYNTKTPHLVLFFSHLTDCKRAVFSLIFIRIHRLTTLWEKGRTMGKFCIKCLHRVRTNTIESDMIIGTMISKHDMGKKTDAYETEEKNENRAHTDRSDLRCACRINIVCIRTTNTDRNHNGNDCANDNRRRSVQPVNKQWYRTGRYERRGKHH